MPIPGLPPRLWSRQAASRPALCCLSGAHAGPGRDCHEEDPRMRPTFHIRSWRPRLGRGVAVLTAAVLGSAGLAAVAAVPVSAAPVCQVAYTVNSDWGTGFSIAITITNNAPAITSWTLGYSYSSNQQLAQGWSGNWSQSGKAITVTNASWNGSLATGASTQIGANFSYTGTNTAPTAFTLNGTPCNGTGGTPSPTPTTPTPTPTSPTPTPTPTS